ncbi:MAG: four helix bundle protein [Thermaceae bacterium]|nr:four helix bundle protein [Thermaceae bacterium]
MAEGQRRGLVGKGFFAFEALEVYWLSVDFAYEVCKPVQRFPDSEKYALVSQLKRAATSVMLSNAEGRGRGSDKDLTKFLFWARDSLLETVSGFHLTERFKFVQRDQAEPIYTSANQLASKLAAFIKTLGGS